MAMYRIQAESTFAAVDLNTGTSSGIDKNKRRKIRLKRPQMKNYVHENNF
jgi:hypothetical protein